MVYEVSTRTTKTAKQRQGDRFEHLAAQLLVQAGYHIVATKYTIAGIGEIDIIAWYRAVDGPKSKNTLVFVEVRSRTRSVFGGAIESITPAKQAKIYRTAQQFFDTHTQYQDCECRFDVMVFDLVNGAVKYEWLASAF